MTSDNNRPRNSKSKQIVYSVSGCCLKIKKNHFGLRTWKGQLKPRVLLEPPLLSRIRREKSERSSLSSPTGGEEGHPRRGRRGSSPTGGEEGHPRRGAKRVIPDGGEEGHPRRGRRVSHIITLSPSTRQQSDITRFYTVRKHLPTLITLNSALVGDLSFPGSV